MQPAAQANTIVNLVPLIFIFAIFYFLLIRPQKIKEKEHLKILSNIGKNDEVITSGGIHGTVVSVKDKTLILRVDDNVKIEFEKNCIAQVTRGQASASNS